jgi:muramoyltetrapeptide carboxypeptidase LdcA involved in peptidoglycan recycling
MKAILPPRLQPGDTIGVVSPSWNGLGLFPHRLERARRYIESLGYELKLAEHALGDRGYVSGTSEERAADIHAMFADPAVKAIVAAIGGDHSCQLLPLLDFDLIARNPKIFIGFSDISVLNVAIHQRTGLVTFNGPAILTDFAENPHMPEYVERYFLRALATGEPIGAIEPAAEWTEEFLDWSTQADSERPRAMQPSPGWTWLRGGVAEGRLLGGCLESLQHLRGSTFWPDWDGAIFFFETAEGAPSPETVDGILMDYENMGVFERIAALIAGRPYGYTPEQRQQLHQVLLERTARWNFPVVAGMDFGHTSPQFTLPLGVRAQVDGERRRFAITEAAVV